jgi:Tol biopolymer transport system component
MKIVDKAGKPSMKKWRFLLGITFIILFSSCVLADQPTGATPGWMPTPTASAAPGVTPSVTQLAGTEMRLLPANYDVWSCEWAPNGKSMVFAGKMQGELSTKMRIWLWPIDPAANPAPFTNTENLTDFSPRWSPDGKQLVILRVTYGRSSVISGLWLKDVPSGGGKQLTSSNQDRDPFWSPDGTKLVFVRSNGPYQSQLMMVNVADGTLTVVHNQLQEVVYSPWWGVNGKIYFAKLNPYQKDVVVANQTYQVIDFGKGSIWALDPRTQTLEPVVADEYDNRLPALSPDGTRLAYVSDRCMGKDGNGKFDRGSLYIKNLLTGETRFVTNKVSLNGGSLSWSPDGKKLAFFTFRSIRPAVWVINLEPNQVGAAGTPSPSATVVPQPIK